MESVAQLTAEPTPDHELLTPSSLVGLCSLPSFEMVRAVHATPAHGGFAHFRDLAAGHAQSPVGLDPEHAVRRYLQPSVGSLRPLFSLRHHGAISFVPTAPVLQIETLAHSRCPTPAGFLDLPQPAWMSPGEAFWPSGRSASLGQSRKSSRGLMLWIRANGMTNSSSTNGLVATRMMPASRSTSSTVPTISPLAS